MDWSDLAVSHGNISLSSSQRPLRALLGEDNFAPWDQRDDEAKERIRSIVDRLISPRGDTNVPVVVGRILNDYSTLNIEDIVDRIMKARFSNTIPKREEYQKTKNKLISLLNRVSQARRALLIEHIRINAASQGVDLNYMLNVVKVRRSLFPDFDNDEILSTHGNEEPSTPPLKRRSSDEEFNPRRRKLDF